MNQRVLWVGKRPLSGKTGEEIYDSRVLAELKQLAQVDVLHPPDASPWEVILNVVRLRPVYRLRTLGREAFEAVSKALTSKNYDLVIFSWEPYDGLAAAVDGPPVLIISHNITSDLLRRTGLDLPSRLLAIFALHWERTLFSRRYRMGVLSVNDAKLAIERGATSVTLVPPGIPPFTERNLAPEISDELILSGTFGWPAKRRALKRFARHRAEIGWTARILVDDVEAVRYLKDSCHLFMYSEFPVSNSVHIGLIVDDFTSGFKLKSLWYVANGCIIFSLTDIATDFAHLPNAAEFVRCFSDVRSLRAEFEKMRRTFDAEMLARFQRFRAAVIEHFTWQRTAANCLESLPIAPDPSFRRSLPKNRAVSLSAHLGHSERRF